jgi:hypothetical protein
MKFSRFHIFFLDKTEHLGSVAIMDHSLAEGTTVAFKHLLTLIGDQVKLDVALDGFSLVFGSGLKKYPMP